jgi:hypothetical protein
MSREHRLSELKKIAVMLTYISAIAGQGERGRRRPAEFRDRCRGPAPDEAIDLEEFRFLLDAFHKIGFDSFIVNSDNLQVQTDTM